MTDDATEKLLVLIKNFADVPGVEDGNKFKVYLRQGLTSTSFFLVIILMGMAYGHSAVLLQQMDPVSDNNTRKIRIENGEIFERPSIVITSLDTQSWIASLMVLFMCPGGWIVAICSKKIGRKPILFTTVALFTSTWMLIAFANDVRHIIIGRSLSGLCIGILSGLLAVYQGECSLPKHRTTLNVSLAMFFCIGMEVSHALGIWFHWRTIAFSSGILGIVTLFFNYKIPESPTWLVKKDKMHKAVHSWIFFRGARDFDELKYIHTEKSLTSNVVEDSKEQKQNRFYTPKFLKPLGIIAMIFTVTEVSGMGAVTFYCIQIISDIVGPDNAYIPTLILDTIRLFFAAVLAVSSRRFSSRALLLFSAFSCSTCLILLFAFLRFEIWTPWSAMILLLSFESSVIMGLGPLPWTFCGELFPASSKEVGLGMVTSYNYVLCFIIVKMNPQLLILLKPWGTFLLYGTLTLIGSVVLYFIVPNTRNKSLKEIELMFSGD